MVVDSPSNAKLVEAAVHAGQRFSAILAVDDQLRQQRIIERLGMRYPA